jgi:hypothetical protein
MEIYLLPDYKADPPAKLGRDSARELFARLRVVVEPVMIAGLRDFIAQLVSEISCDSGGESTS